MVTFCLITPAPCFPAEITLTLENEKLSVCAHQAPLKDVLKRLAGFGIRVRIDPAINPEITVSFQDRDVASGLQAVLRHLNHVLIWEKRSESRSSTECLVEIQIFQPGGKDRMIPLEGDRNLSISRDPSTGAIYVSNEILIRPEPGTGADEIEAIIIGAGGTILMMVENRGVYRIVLSDQTDIHLLLEHLGKEEKMGRPELNYAYSAAQPFHSTGGRRIPVLPAATGTQKTAGAPVAVLDSGVTFVPGLEGIVVTGMDALEPADDFADSLGHGTQMALIASGVVAPLGSPALREDFSPVIGVKLFDDNGLTSNFAVLRALSFAVDKGARVISMSWSSETESAFLADACGKAASSGAMLVAAAGNEPTGRPVFPAAFDTVIGVGALDAHGNTWRESNFGTFVPVFAPGIAMLPVGHRGDPGVYAGTSIATAYVARRLSAAARLHPEATDGELLEIISRP